MGPTVSVHLALLGGFAASLSSGRPVELAGKKNQALLAYLGVNRGKRLSRQKLMELLWSDRGEAQARGSLRQAMAALKEALAGVEPAPLVLEGDTITLNPGAVSTDVASFELLAGSKSAEDLRQAARLYEGDLLDGLTLRDAAYEEWLSGERARLREAAIDTISRLIAQLTGAETVAMAKRLVTLDPLREASHRALMQAYAAAGEKTFALQAYAACRDTLKAELGVVPAKATEELRLRIVEDELRLPPPKEQPSPTSAQQRAPSIAVLAFTNMSADPEQEYFSDGITDDIITDLSRVSAIHVAARHSTFAFKGKTVDIGEVARRLNVGYVLEGSIRKAGNRVRISAQLIDAETGNHIWAERYDRELEDIFALQDEISKNVVSALKVKLLPDELKTITSRSTTNPQAYECYLLGRSTCHGGWGDKRLLRSAREIFVRATDLDPGYARAYAAIADCDTYLWSAGDLDISSEDILANSAKALALAPNLAEAHASKGIALYRAGHLDEAAASLERAIELDPDLFEARFFYGMVCKISDRLDKAISQFTRAAELRPTDYVSLNVLADVYSLLGLREQCIATAMRTMARIEAALAKQPDSSVLLAWGASTFAYLGEKSKAQEWAKRAVALNSDDYFVAYIVACAYASIGKLGTAMEYLEFVFSRVPRFRPVLLAWIKHDTQLDALRDQPEFCSFVQRLELAVDSNL